MIRPYILAETNWESLKKEKFELAVLPWGATEAHNYHLPYGTDVYESDHLAAESARVAWEKGAKVIVLPSVPFGVNTGQSDIYLDINLNPSTQFAILSDIITVLNRQGIHKLLIFNSHGGNNFKPLVRELGLKFPNMFICFSNWFQSLDKTKYFKEAGDHADEMETSLMLYLRPDLVLPKEKWGTGASKQYKINSFSEGWVWAERKWSQISEDTGVGNPMYSTSEKGERFFKDVTEKIGQLLLEICEADTENLYE
ncbi:creatininase family protein [Flavobacteriaceae bacterium F89]|uniref:Creatininase family protein n=1 Tax=Cerina litoralis TaxID=2874477 RepID=A0AAE3EW02_9FLAO|nr:creatininase family protein [Cerina litoralis]MCG2462125.1 creatininase family protein [Cerina litoralis]